MLLLWLHEQEVIRLNKGLAVFRSAMTIQAETGDAATRALPSSRLQTPRSFITMNRRLQIHVMAEYVQRGLEAMADALHHGHGLFQFDAEKNSCNRWLPDQEQKELERQTTPESWQIIVESLKNPNPADELSLTTGSRGTTCWCWPAPARVRRACWCIALPT